MMYSVYIATESDVVSCLHDNGNGILKYKVPLISIRSAKLRSRQIELETKSAVHKTAGLTVSQFCLVLFHRSTEKCHIGCEWSHRQERPTETVLYGGFVNSAVNLTNTC